ncbi:GLPGLI family protein [Niabella drilacis]|uniref:GLPGLI family protein n=1 Tax=Niabella drilacis (strain DSM 25811 / CCM 8410 / CCUG 62505 / LMG 26954 / E90) TaxID=1285928 RepID=A0A1G6LPC8_NIADE|nr:GLPGLI family protein [Niabella drilacis]SDC45158.1 GLPGLI family protein [Niabella drilacis]
MKYLITFLALAVLLTAIPVHAQKFITSGTVEYEVKTNIKKGLEAEDDMWSRALLDKIPAFSVNYYNFSFQDNKGLYKFDHTGDKQKIGSWLSGVEEDNIWYNDYGTQKYTNLITIDNYNIVEGDLRKIRWKLSPTETTVIAGFNCRKASAVLFDSVYIFAYYTEEIPVTGGPMGLHGLPGLILGVTVPRLYTSWIATSLKLDPAVAIKPPSKGKKVTEAFVMNALNEYGKRWTGGSKFTNTLIWRTFL